MQHIDNTMAVVECRSQAQKDVELTEAGQRVDSTPSEMWWKLGTLRHPELAKAGQHAVRGGMQADNVEHRELAEARQRVDSTWAEH